MQMARRLVQPPATDPFDIPSIPDATDDPFEPQDPKPAKKSRKKKSGDFTEPPPLGAPHVVGGEFFYCAVCLEPQYIAPSGDPKTTYCENAHGGAASLDQVTRDERIEKAKQATALETSGKLAKEIAKTEEEERHARARKRFDFEVSNAAKKSPLRPDVQRVVESVFVDDIGGLYDVLEKELHLGDDHSDRGSLAARLGNAASNMRKAHRIFVTAKVEKESWESRNNVIFGAMWLEATKALQEEKDAKQRNKQITDGDVKMKAAAIFGDEWHAQETERRRVKEMVESLSNLVDAWTAHHRALEVLLGKSR